MPAWFCVFCAWRSTLCAFEWCSALRVGPMVIGTNWCMVDQKRYTWPVLENWGRRGRLDDWLCLIDQYRMRFPMGVRALIREIYTVIRPSGLLNKVWFMQVRSVFMHNSSSQLDTDRLDQLRREDCTWRALFREPTERFITAIVLQSALLLRSKLMLVYQA